MAALSGEKTLAELSAEFGVHPTMISNWKQELVKRAGELFARGSKAPAVADAQKVIDDLHRKIGQLQVERDFLAGQPAISRVLRGGRWRTPTKGLDWGKKRGPKTSALNQLTRSGRSRRVAPSGRRSIAITTACLEGGFGSGCGSGSTARSAVGCFSTQRV
jgi:transposase